MAVNHDHLDSVIILDTHSSTPSAPASGKTAIGIRSDGSLITKNSAGVEATFGWQHILMPSDVTVNNTTTLTNLTGLSFSMAANATYEIILCVKRAATTSTMTTKIGHTCPALEASALYEGTTASNVGASGQNASGISITTGTVTTAATYFRRMIMKTSASGTFQAQFAQGTAVAEDLVAKATESFIRYRRIA